MPAIPIRFKFDPGPMIGLIRRLRTNLATQGSPLLRSAYLGVADQYLTGIRQRFVRFSHGGGDWAKLKPSTIRRKGGDTRILQHKGPLLRSLSRGGAGNIFQATKTGARVGTSIPYSVYHQTGTSRMPAREIIVAPDEQLSNAMQKRLAVAVEAGIQDAVKSLTTKPRTAA